MNLDVADALVEKLRWIKIEEMDMMVNIIVARSMYNRERTSLTGGYISASEGGCYFGYRHTVPRQLGNKGIKRGEGE